MSKGKRKKISNGHGGARVRAGHPKTGITKTKICVSVTNQTWQAAVNRWKQKPSWLVDGLLLRYIETGGSILEKEAAI